MAIKSKIRHADGSGLPMNPGDQAKSHFHPPSSVQPVEAEQPLQSGGDPDLQKRVLNENFEGGAAQQHPESPAGQHATGSFTGGDSSNLKKTPPRTPRKSGHR